VAVRCLMRRDFSFIEVVFSMFLEWERILKSLLVMRSSLVFREIAGSESCLSTVLFSSLGKSCEGLRLSYYGSRTTELGQRGFSEVW